MDTIVTNNIDGYEVIIGFDKQVVDPESTKQRAAILNKPYWYVLSNNPVYFEPRPGEYVSSEIEIRCIKKIISTLKYDELLTINYEVVRIEK